MSVGLEFSCGVSKEGKGWVGFGLACGLLSSWKLIGGAVCLRIVPHLNLYARWDQTFGPAMKFWAE